MLKNIVYLMQPLSEIIRKTSTLEFQKFFGVLLTLHTSEIVALREALFLLKQLNMQRVDFEMDSKIVVDIFLSSKNDKSYQLDLISTSQYDCS